MLALPLVSEKKKGDKKLEIIQTGKGASLLKRIPHVLNVLYVMFRQARRRTGTQEEFLYPERIKTRRDPRLDPVDDENEATALVPSLSLVPALPCPVEPKGARQISPELMQKLLELEKSRKGQNSETVMPPPPSSQGNQSQSQGGPVKTSRSNSLNGNGTAPVPASLVRGNIKSKSARSFPVSKFGNSGSAYAIQPRSQPSSPALQRKSLPDRPGAG